MSAAVLTAREERDRRVTILLLCTSLLHFILTAPQVVGSVLILLNMLNETMIVAQVMLFTDILGCSFNLLVFLGSGAMFRSRIKEIVTKCLPNVFLSRMRIGEAQ